MRAKFATIQAPFPAGTFPNSVLVEPSGRFAYVKCVNSNDLFAYSINAQTGVLAQIPGSPFAASGFSIAAYPSADSCIAVVSTDSE
jgi:hypothetical protein